jgi:hypothetical protein
MTKSRTHALGMVMALASAMAVGACAPDTGSRESTVVLDQVAESYVRLVLAVGEHDADYVDAYYGPPEWRDEVTAEQLGLPAIEARADSVIEGAPSLRLPGNPVGVARRSRGHVGGTQDDLRRGVPGPL